MNFVFTVQQRDFQFVLSCQSFRTLLKIVFRSRCATWCQRFFAYRRKLKNVLNPSFPPPWYFLPSRRIPSHVGWAGPADHAKHDGFFVLTLATRLCCSSGDNLILLVKCVHGRNTTCRGNFKQNIILRDNTIADCEQSQHQTHNCRKTHRRKRKILTTNEF